MKKFFNVILCGILLLSLLFITGCKNELVEENELESEVENEEITWKTDAQKEEIVNLMRYLRVSDTSSENSFENWINEMRNLINNNLFAKKITEAIDETNYSELEEYEKSFLDFYVKQIIFDENSYSQKVLCYDIQEHYGNITNAYKVNYDNKYSDIPKALLIRFDKNQKTSYSFEYYVSFINENNIKTQTNFFKELKNGSTIYYIYSKNVTNITDSFTTSYPISIEEIDINNLEEILLQYNDIFQILIEYRDEIYKPIRDNELQVEYQEEKEDEDLSNSIPKVGMSASEVRKTKWGSPDKINKDTYSWGTSEQWVYNKYGYVYLENGIVTSVSER